MFDFLKKKISNFVDKVTGKEEEKIEGKAEEKPKVEPDVEKPVEKKPVVKPKPPEKKPEVKAKEKPVKKPEVKKPEVRKEAPKPKIIEKKPEVKPEPVREEKPAEKIPEPEPEPVEVKEEKPSEVKPPEPEPEPEKVEVKERKIGLGVVSRVKSIITGEVEITEGDIKETLDTLELELIEGDVSIEIAEMITAEIREKLVGKKVGRGKINEFIKNQITDVLKDAMTTGKEFDILEKVRNTEKPVKIMFLGINGSGKTTTIAKIANLLMKNGHTVVLAGSDTFRAAAIEQLQVHADRLGVKAVKRDYGSDPASVAFDAVSHAKAHGIDVVLIDTAGRQETNINLMNELKKIQRVIEPDINLYIGESIAGTAVIEQVRTFNSDIGVDGIVLTKIDCDAKGGTVISAAKASGVPIVLIGTGQKYEDIEIFKAGKIIERILG